MRATENKRTAVNIFTYKFFVQMLFWQLFARTRNVHVTYMYVEKAAETTFVQKTCAFNVDEIDTCMMKKDLSEVNPAKFCSSLFTDTR